MSGPSYNLGEMADRESERLLHEIQSDHRSGALALTRRAGDALRALAQELQNEPEDRARLEIELFAQRLSEAQPAMASIRNLAERARSAVRQRGPEAMLDVADAFLRALAESTPKIVEHASDLVFSSQKIITISFSTTVLEILLNAKRRGISCAVICPESRPLLEGVELARALGEREIPATICADALGPSLVAKSDLVLVGGDALAPQGLVNKIGTYPLALAAREANVPFIAALSELKFLSEFDPGRLPEMDPDELLPNPPPRNVRVLNRYFDLTPLDMLSQVVTEERIYTSHALQEVLRCERSR
jgi:translation initiation factor 2B subunit (eIF-2B alpha/beta/delta family)